MYTLYSDSREVTQEVIHRRNLTIKAWMKRTSIGDFPKSVTEMNSVRSLFEEYSKNITQLCFVFVSDDATCQVLQEGKWINYDTFDDACYGIYKEEEHVVLHVKKYV